MDKSWRFEFSKQMFSNICDAFEGCQTLLCFLTIILMHELISFSIIEIFKQAKYKDVTVHDELSKDFNIWLVLYS